MTLHQSIEIAKKIFLGILIGIVLIILFTLLFRVGLMIKNAISPAKIVSTNHLYDKLPALQFPKNSTADKLSYKLNTLTGTFPQFPDRLDIFPIIQAQPNLLNLQKARNKAISLGFTTDQGTASFERNLGNDTYHWSHSDDIQRELTINILSFNFSLSSNYLSSPTVQGAKTIQSTKDAVSTTKSFLQSIGFEPTDIDYDKTINASEKTPYFTQPQLFSIANNALVSTTSISTTQVIRVDLYQKNMTYSLDTGISNGVGGTKKLDMDLPILYPHPPYSTMSFWVASGGISSEVYAANFNHQSIVIPEDSEATYPIKTAQEAYDELTHDKGYIASYFGSDKAITINDVYLAYYLGENSQQYLMPIIVFEGDNGFFAYVSAINDNWIK